MASQRSASANSGMPEDVQTLMQKYRRMKSFIDQYEEEWELLEKLKEVCSDLVTFKTKEKALTLYGPGLPSQVQIKADMNEWTNAQNNAMAKQDIVDVILQDYKRQRDAYEHEIRKRGYEAPPSDSVSASKEVRSN